ncbi:hypothetical protein S40293_01117 [Stachybotrys chartarum IBT 40293]|nr:hypothetical protein S40293_01117 [Stachybotrys chartarum IBT 40293]
MGFLAWVKANQIAHVFRAHTPNKGKPWKAFRTFSFSPEQRCRNGEFPPGPLRLSGVQYVHSDTPGGSMKYPRACRRCRENKRKCIRGGLGQPCELCKQRGFECDSPLKRQSDDHRLLAVRKPTDSLRVVPEPRSSLPTHAFELPFGMAVEMIEHYLDKINDKPHSIFHPATLRSQLNEGTITKALLYAVCAIGSKFSTNPDVRAWETRLAAEAKRLLQADLENICIENIQTCILVTTLSVDYCNTSEALYFRIATAMSDILCLNYATSSGSLITDEVRRRIWWSLYLADGWCIAGLGLASQMKDVAVTIDLPMDESVFHALQPGQKILGSPWQPGLWAHFISLGRLSRPIQDVTRRAASGQTSLDQLDQEVEQLAQQLEHWSENLPSRHHMTMENMYEQQEKGVGGLFVTLHLAYHHHAMLLYFRFLENHQTESTVYRTYIARCKTHASSFSALLRRSRQLKGCEANYPLVGHTTTVCSSVLLHTLLFGEVHELQLVREELNANFEALIELSRYWPGTSVMVRFAFVCMKRPNGAQRSAAQPSEKTDTENISSQARRFQELGRYVDFQSF